MNIAFQKHATVESTNKQIAFVRRHSNCHTPTTGVRRAPPDLPWDHLSWIFQVRGRQVLLRQHRPWEIRNKKYELLTQEPNDRQRSKMRRRVRSAWAGLLLVSHQQFL